MTHSNNKQVTKRLWRTTALSAALVFSLSGTGSQAANKQVTKRLWRTTALSAALVFSLSGTGSQAAN
ncbi:hypothetical protein, partial [Psychrobacter pocilloporae]|uniref:hypothetical protein n=1 Tax=Psychrobacter pocilloporae TaxID=1775882 RepID=UPI003C2C9417